MNISFYLLLKAEGRSVKNHPVIEQLVRIRLLIDKLRPLDQKLKYQIEKLVKAAAVGGSIGAGTKKTLFCTLLSSDGGMVLADETLKHKPNLKAFGDEAESDEEGQSYEDEDGEVSKVSKSGLYVAPKISATHLDRAEEKRNRREAKRDSKAKNSLMAQHVIEEFGDEPVEQPADLIARQADSGEEERKEREEYEEETFQRLTLTKKDRKKRKVRILCDWGNWEVGKRTIRVTFNILASSNGRSWVICAIRP